MSRKLSLVFLLLCLIFTQFTLTAWAYTAGPISVICSFTKDVEQTILLPFDIAKVKISHDSTGSPSPTITIHIDGLLFSKKATILSTSTTIDFLPLVRCGEKTVKITGTGITNAEFYKENIETGELINNGETNKQGVINLTAYEQKLQTAIVVGKYSNIAKVRLAKHYINPNNPKLIPKELNGKLYLPADFISTSLSYYIEQTENNIKLRNIDTELYFSDTMNYSKKNGIINTITDLRVIDGGIIYLPLKELSEYAGMYYFYDGDIAILDDYKYYVDEIKNDILTELKTEFAGYVVSVGSNRTFYVAANAGNASDNNDGSQDAPFKTLSMAGTVATAGDTVYVDDGVYRETLSILNSGTTNSPITFKVMDGKKAIISGTEVVNGFVQHSGNIYKAPTNINLDIKLDTDDALEKGKNQVFIGGEAISEARYPNVGDSSHHILDKGEFGTLWPIFGDLKAVRSENGGTTYKALSSTLLNQPDNYWVGASYVSLSYYGWSLETATVSESTNGSVTLNNRTDVWWYPSFVGEGVEYEADYGYLQGHYNALDIDNEWVIKDGYIYIVKPNNVSAQDLSVEIKKRQNTINLNGKTGIVLDGFETFAGSMVMSNTNNSIIKNQKMKYISHFTQFDDSRDGFIDCSWQKDTLNAPNRGEVGNYIGGANNVIMNSSFDYSAGAGLYIVGSGHNIENNEISNCGYMGLYPSGIYVTFEVGASQWAKRGGHTVLYNTVRNSGRAAFGIFGNDINEWYPKKGDGSPYLFAEATDYTKFLPYLPMEIAYNDFYNCAYSGQRDGGIINSFQVILGTDRRYSKIHNNLIWNRYQYENIQENVNFGIYYDNGTQMLESYNNMIFSSKENTEFRRPYLDNDGFVLAGWYTNIVRTWGTKELGYIPNGKLGLKSGDYPNGDVFLSGAKSLQTTNIQETIWNSTFGAEVSSGVTLDNTLQKFSANGQWVKIANVDFGVNSNKMEIVFTGDRYKGENRVEIKLDDNTPLVKDVKLKSTANNPTDRNTRIFDIEKTSGVHSVLIKVTAFSSFYLDKIRVYKEEKLKSEVVRIVDMAPDVDEFGNSGKNGTYVAMAPQGKLSVANTYYGNYAKYNNVVFDKIVNYIEVIGQSNTQQTPQTMNIYLNSLNSTPVATCIINGKDWHRNTFKVTMTNEIQPGIYDVYFRFETPNVTSNLDRVIFKNYENALSVDYQNYTVGKNIISNMDSWVKLTSNFSIKNRDSKNSKNATAIATVYNKDGKIKNISTKEISVEPNKIKEEKIVAFNPTYQKGDYLKTYIWEANSLNPLYKPISLISTQEAPEYTQNQVINSGFEQLIPTKADEQIVGYPQPWVNWTALPNNASIVSNEKYTGEYSLKVDGSLGIFGTVTQMCVPVLDNAQYKVSFYSKIPTGNMYISFSTYSGDIGAWRPILNSDDWEQQSFIINSGSGATYLYVSLLDYYVGSNTAYFDDFKIEKIK